MPTLPVDPTQRASTDPVLPFTWRAALAALPSWDNTYKAGSVSVPGGVIDTLPPSFILNVVGEAYVPSSTLKKSAPVEAEICK